MADKSSNATWDKLRALNSVYTQVEAETGHGPGGKWPPPGIHPCVVLDMSCKESSFRSGDGQEFPGVEIQFRYELLEDPDNSDPMQFRGAPFRLPLDPTQIVPDNTRKRVEIETSRLKGHFKTLLGQSSPNIEVDLQAVDALLNDSTLTCAQVRCQERKVNDRIYHTEFLLEKIES